VGKNRRVVGNSCRAHCGRAPTYRMLQTLGLHGIRRDHDAHAQRTRAVIVVNRRKHGATREP